MLLCGTILSQQNKNPRRELDSLRQIVIGPKLKLYDQQVEKFTSRINGTKDKHRIKQYAKEIVLVSKTFEDEIAVLYDNGNSYSRGNVYFGAGIGMGPWIYPGMGGWIYPGSYGYNNLPPLFYDVDRVRKYANNMRLFTGSSNVNKKLGYIHKTIAKFERDLEK